MSLHTVCCVTRGYRVVFGSCRSRFTGCLAHVENSFSDKFVVSKWH